MDKYRALIKYEFRSLKWMLIYFLLVCGSVLFILSETMEGKRRSFFEHTDVWQIQNTFVRQLDWVLALLLIGMVGGLILLVYVQFRDAKNIEVGRFLKTLPVQSSKIYWIRMGCGILTYTVPFMIYIIGVIALRMNHSDWLNDYYSISPWQNGLLEVESVGYISILLIIYYLIITGVYLVLLLMQYLISNRIFAVVVSVILYAIPIYIAMILTPYMNIDLLLTSPVLYGALDTTTSNHVSNGESIYIRYISLLGVKVCLLILVIGLAMFLGWMSSKYFLVEDQNKLIPKSVCRKIFIVVGTLCIALIPMFYFSAFEMMRWYELNLIPLVGGMIVLGLVGYIMMYKIAMIGCKEK